jgi:hypothetical protein
MEWLLEVSVVGLSINIFLIATAWYARVIIQPSFPEWWERHICAPCPEEAAIKAYVSSRRFQTAISPDQLHDRFLV